MKPNEAAKKVWTHSALHMDTIVHMQVISEKDDPAEIQNSLKRAFAAFRFVEDKCSRFDDQSEVRQLTMQIGTPVQVSPLLFEATRFAWEVAHLTQGKFDPTIGYTMEMNGFTRNYLTKKNMSSNITLTQPVSYLDISLHEEQQTVLLHKPLILDLGAVAKGLAIDLARKELAHYEGYMIDAGGDIFVGGRNERDELWLVGVSHPLLKNETICTLKLTDSAICTSGSYERVSPLSEAQHHLIHPQTGKSANELLSCTVIAPFAMMADAFSTAAFILGQERGLAQLENLELDGLSITSSLNMYMTRKMKGYVYEYNG